MDLDRPTERPSAPLYIDPVLADYDRDGVGRFNHLGHWDDPDDDPLATSRLVAQQRMNDILVDMAGIGDGMRVLDVGSGFGGTLASVDGRFSGVDLVGVDIDIRQLGICRRRISARPGNTLTWVNASATELPFTGGAFDAAVCIEAMWHFPSRAAFLAEAARVLRPGARLAVVELLIAADAGDRMGMDGDELVKTLETGFYPWPEPHTTLEDLRDAAADAGLAVREHRDATANTRPTYLDHGDGDERPGAAEFSANQGVRLFVRMHLEGSLSVHYLCFERLGA